MKMKEEADAEGVGKRLKEYAAIPGTPPPEQRKDSDVVRLERELHREKTYMSALLRENREIEDIIRELEREIAYVKYNFPQSIDRDGRIHADNEYWFRYEAQMEANRKLEREKRHLESEVRQMEEQGTVNLDSLTQSELILYVKQLERTKTDLASELRAKEWSLDKQAKDYHHLKETKRMLEAEIRHYDGEHALFHHYKRISCPSASASVSRQSSQKNSARRVRFVRQKDGKTLQRGGSVSHENLFSSAANDAPFRHPKESEADNGTALGRRTLMEGEATSRASAVAPGSVGSLPELSRPRSRTPPAAARSPSKGDGTRGGIATEQVRKGSESDANARSAESRNESGIGSESEVAAEEYEDDFEESDTEAEATREA